MKNERLNSYYISIVFVLFLVCCNVQEKQNDKNIKEQNENKLAEIEQKKEKERIEKDKQEQLRIEQAQREEEERKQAEIEAEAKKCYHFNKERDRLVIACSTPESAEQALFLGLIEWHKNFNPWGGEPVIKKDRTLMTPDGKSMKVKYFLLQLDKFGEEHGEGSTWLMGQTFDLENGKWSTGVQLMQTMHY
jgi:hypothetical protein